MRNLFRSETSKKPKNNIEIAPSVRCFFCACGMPSATSENSLSIDVFSVKNRGIKTVRKEKTAHGKE